jgi:hypothetical protein
LSQFINKYRDNHWGREVLHNKITDPYAFLKQEFPKHTVQKTNNLYQIETADLFNLSANLQLIANRLKDGVAFQNTEQYTVDANQTVHLPTGDLISLSELNQSDIEIIAPFLNQLIAMHRGLGTKLINFLLIPADVQTFFVVRDPERLVYEFASYTDLLLMLSYYWQDHQLFFNIERVKKVNNYIEFEALLLAKSSLSENFDYAEVKFSLDREYRISVAMIVLHTNVTP